LSDHPANIKVGTVLRVLEGQLSVIDEKSEEKDKSEASIEYCIKVSVWDKMNACLNDFADSITLEDLAESYKKMNQSQNMLYYI